MVLKKKNIDDNNNIYSEVIEIEDNEQFVLYNVTNATGSYVSMMRENYNKIISDIKDNCSNKQIFKNDQAIRISSK